MRWFPAVGLIVGALVAGAGWAGARIDPWTGALAALILWVAVTGALHLDGLGDIADGSGAAHKDRERLLAVLGDPHAGSFAVVAISLQLIATLVLLHALIERARLEARRVGKESVSTGRSRLPPYPLQNNLLKFRFLLLFCFLNFH